VVAGHGVDRALEVAVGAEELRPVVGELARGVDHVAADDAEVRVRGLREQPRDDGVLAVVALAGVAQQQEGERAVAAADHEVRVGPGGLRALTRQPDPLDPGAIDRVVEVLGEDVVA
jgi:hypothetical protein